MIIRIIHGFFEYYCKYDKINTLFWSTIFSISCFIYIFTENVPTLIGWLSFGIYYHIGYMLNYTHFFDILNLKKCCLLAMSMIVLGIILPDNCVTIYNKFLIGTGLTIGLSSLLYRYKLSCNILEYCGKNSMVFYLAPLMYTPLIRVILMKVGISDFTIQLVLGTTISIIIGFIIIYFYQNIKFFKWVEYLFYPLKLLRKYN